jgi:hypothetical protein
LVLMFVLLDEVGAGSRCLVAQRQACVVHPLLPWLGRWVMASRYAAGACLLPVAWGVDAWTCAWLHDLSVRF